ncbi:MAG TPA: hypothetical protein VIK89_15125 [Cytophagaceae bacterium]
MYPSPINNYRYLLLAFIIQTAVYTSPAYSQTRSEIADMELYAEAHFKKEDYKSALKYYLKLDSIKPDNPHYIYPIGISYLNTFNTEKAYIYFSKCLKTPEKFNEALYYYSGKTAHLEHKMEEAIKHYEKYKQLISQKKSKNLDKQLEKIDKEIAMCKTGIELMANSLKYDIINLGNTINSPYADYTPVLSADESIIIFTSRRPNKSAPQETDGSYNEDIYIAYKGPSGWSVPMNIGDGINSAGHDAAIALAQDGQKLIFYRSGDLYISELHGNIWVKAEKLPEQINSKDWEPSASISPDQKILYFSSNRPGGYGGLDLYSVKKLPNGEWALPQNMGSKINTPYDEDSPFIHPDGKSLYFCSNGHKTMGGFDLFVSTFDEEKNEWSEPVNVGYPISTAHDDLNFSFSADGRRVYFSTIKNDGVGDKDIYYAYIYKEPAKVMLMKGFVYDNRNQKPLQATISVKDKSTGEDLGVFHSNSATGKYILVFTEGKEYDVSFEAKGYQLCDDYKKLFNNINISNFNEYEEVEQNIGLCPK